MFATFPFILCASSSTFPLYIYASSGTSKCVCGGRRGVRGVSLPVFIDREEYVVR